MADRQEGDIVVRNGRYYQLRKWRKEDGRWSLLPDLLAQETRLSPNARWAYVLLLSASRRMNGGRAGWVEYPEEWLARDLGATAKSVRHWVSELERYGFLEIDKEELRTPEGRKTPKFYLVYEPDEVEYLVEVTRAQALNSTRAKTRPPTGNVGQGESVGSRDAEFDADYRPLRTNDQPPTPHELLEERENTEGENTGDRSNAADIPSQGKTEPVSFECNESLPALHQEEMAPGSVTAGSCVANGNRHLRTNTQDQDDSLEDADVPPDCDLIASSVTKLVATNRYMTPKMAARLRQMNVEEIRTLALLDPDAAYVVDARRAVDDRQRWVDLIVAMAARFVDGQQVDGE